MVPVPISAPDAIAPAFNRARQLLLIPFRWSIWWRLALISMAISGEVWGNLVRIPDILNATRSARRGSEEYFAAPSLPSIFPGMSMTQIAVFIAVLATLFLILVLVHMYIGSVLRFILFDAVATGRYRLRAGWKMWEPKGRRLFLFNLLLMVIFLLIMGVVVGGFVAALISMGVGKAGVGKPGMAIAAVLLLIPVILVLALIAYVVITIAYDLALPIMGLEGISGTAAFGRAWGMVKATKGDYAAYLGLKFVLGIALGIVIAIVQLVIFLPIVFGVIFMVAAMGIGAPQLLSNPVLLAALITAAFFGFIALSFVLALVSVPIRVIFQAYALIFFAPRYLLLYTMMYGAPPAPPAPEPPPALEPSPMPA
jgi:hypothetical protein